eukprot:TRINITY_DN5756_c0_g1_i3.p1 TRINITY_DN5756_c0_g1~~TRINITY_DN5756_c0_g1_i3.p1  ORF type:complete len:115 (+),score=4.69 TRINITY_DN5756_c0_g1_i3:51-395(+)
MINMLVGVVCPDCQLFIILPHWTFLRIHTDTLPPYLFLVPFSAFFPRKHSDSRSPCLLVPFLSLEPCFHPSIGHSCAYTRTVCCHIYFLFRAPPSFCANTQQPLSLFDPAIFVT